MTLAPPPADYDGTPVRHALLRGTCLWHVHKRAYPAGSFNSVPSSPMFGGGRFDSTDDDRYPYWYAALDERTALAEILLRDLPYDRRGARALTREAVEGRRISGLTLTRDLDLVRLIDEVDLAAVAQDQWLVIATGHEYAQTRAWGHWLRGKAPWAHGFIWHSRRDHGRPVIVLFGDRCATAFGTDYEKKLLHEVSDLATDLDDKAGAEWLNGLLAPYRVAVSGL